MLNRATFYHTSCSQTKVVKEGVVIESMVNLSCMKVLSHEQYAQADEEVLKGVRRHTAEQVWEMLYGDLACTLERAAAATSDHNTADLLRTIVAKLAP